ncbi:hypothetical protein AB0C15_10830 [Micromonospora sp. NPDC048835]
MDVTVSVLGFMVGLSTGFGQQVTRLRAAGRALTRSARDQPHRHA